MKISDLIAHENNERFAYLMYYEIWTYSKKSSIRI